MVQFKQLRTTTPRKKRNELTQYTATNETDIQNLYDKNTSMEIVSRVRVKTEQKSKKIQLIDLDKLPL